ncbi:hypothetical protein M433DRAFT_493931 [Acidomyces richmondensis BFW]|nr:MAG: hypothetical protein FE78DRAFT_294027 [Acidomyces sp. 'richmondensis']KYG47465.1 hypothetical protein M433DRAFT_493931 [Acidomyces richmondensis BFW]
MELSKSPSFALLVISIHSVNPDPNQIIYWGLVASKNYFSYFCFRLTNFSESFKSWKICSTWHQVFDKIPHPIKFGFKKHSSSPHLASKSYVGA